MSDKFDLDEIWKTTLAQIEVKLDSPAHFKTWFKNTSLLGVEGKEALVGVQNAYSSDWLRSRHDKMIADRLSYVYGKPVKIKYVIDKRLANEPTPKVTAEEVMKESPLIGISTMLGQDLNLLLKKANLNPNYTFESMIVGSSNRLVHAAAKAVADKPGQVYNPLFIYGKTGLGKTHMAHAIARKLLEKDPTSKALYATSEDFLNDMVNAIKSGKNKQFRDKYRSLDVLIIDDVQFTHKWKETQTEFFHTFNVLHSYNKQIILVSDRPPEEIKNLESRLRSRFQGGMIVDIAKPDYEMRLAILQQKSAQMGVDLPAHFNDFIAKAYADNIRELEGALHKVALYHSMRELSLEEVAKILGKDKKTKRSRVNIAKVIREVSKEFNITVKELKGPRRTAEIAFARQVCMYLLREDFDFKLEDVAKQLERKDHTTVMHAVDKIKSKMLVDEGFKNQIDLIRDNISQHLEADS